MSGDLDLQFYLLILPEHICKLGKEQTFFCWFLKGKRANTTSLHFSLDVYKKKTLSLTLSPKCLYWIGKQILEFLFTYVKVGFHFLQDNQTM